MENDKPISVCDAVAQAQSCVKTMPSLCVNGEVSGYRGPNARSGHCYFQLKDAQSSMDVIMWRSTFNACNFQMKDGLQLEVRGSFNIYGASGKLSFVITSAHVAGEGLLRLQVAQLAKKLEAEGLMSDARKRPIPRFCSRIVVCTSLSGSVIEDVKRTLARRNPLVEIQAVGCSVQGAQAPATICRALTIAAQAKPDAILLVRGGGSFEDLMCFNDESVARAVAASPIPVITGIGHEPDTSICDLVSDRRTSTPTAAAESVAPAFDEVQGQIWERQRRLAQAMSAILKTQRANIESLSQSANRVIHSKLAETKVYLDHISSRKCLTSPDAFISEKQTSLELTAERLFAAMPRDISRFRERTTPLFMRFNKAGVSFLQPYKHALSLYAQALDTLSPLKSLARGYSIVQADDGHVVSSALDINVGDRIAIMLGTGSLHASVSDICTTNKLSKS